jgi:hypothetical protein
MWYQRLSKPYMPWSTVEWARPAHSANSATTTTPAITVASRPDGRLAGALTSSGRVSPHLEASRPIPVPSATQRTTSGASSRAPTAPSASSAHTSNASPTTDSASRAGAPDHPGRTRARTRSAAKARARTIAPSSATPAR